MHKQLAFVFSVVVLCCGFVFQQDARAAESAAQPVNYNEVVAAYHADAEQAAARYDNKRLAFTGVVMRMGSDPEGTYFGAVADDGAQFDTSFDVADQQALKDKFESGEIVPFASSSTIVFECLNEGLVGTAVAGLKLTHCKLSE